jgi:formylglycine-generating enzyme required for sulfatase activity
MICGGDQPEHTTTLSTYALDKYEVTVGRFRAFVDAYALGWRPAVGSGMNPNVKVGDTSWQKGWDDSTGLIDWAINLPWTGVDVAATAANFARRLKCSQGYETWTDVVGKNENRPISCVGWYEAFAFCIWDGGRLPTEAEWEYAAAGGSENRLYPWGSAAPDCTYANIRLNDRGGSECTAPNPSAVDVGSAPRGNGRFGHADLAGNVEEWNFDWPGSYTNSDCTDCANLSADAKGRSCRIMRGGGFGHTPVFLRAAFRTSADLLSSLPGSSQPFSPRMSDTGLRCARTAP